MKIELDAEAVTDSCCADEAVYGCLAHSIQASVIKAVCRVDAYSEFDVCHTVRNIFGWSSGESSRRVEVDVVNEGSCFGEDGMLGSSTDGLRYSKKGKVGHRKAIIVVLRAVIEPENSVGFVEAVAVDLILEFVRKLEKGTAGFDETHGDEVMKFSDLWAVMGVASSVHF